MSILYAHYRLHPYVFISLRYPCLIYSATRYKFNVIFEAYDEYGRIHDI